MRRGGVTGRRVRLAVLVAAVAMLPTLPVAASAMPLRAAPTVTADLASSVDDTAVDAIAAAALDRHDEADLAARGDGSMPEWMSPVVMYATSAVFGERGRHWTTRHTGLDFKAPRGTRVYAVHDGTVVKLAWHKAYGRMVILEVSPGITIWYCHLSKVTIKPGPVKAGQQLGLIGSTGNASGPHLHLEVRAEDRPTDPEPYLFGTPPGQVGTPPSWLPPRAIITVANLPWLKNLG